MNKLLILSSILLILLARPLLADRLISLNDVRTYDFLENLLASGKIKIDFVGIKPYSAQTIYQQLQKIENKDRQIKSFIERFEEEYISYDSRFANSAQGNTKNWIDPFLNLSYLQQEETNGNNKVGGEMLEGGLKIMLNYKDYLTLYTNSSVKIIPSQDKLRDEFRNPLLLTNGEEGSFSSQDYTETYLNITGDDLDFTIGKFPLSEGTGYLSSLTLNKQYSYYDAINFNWKMGNFKFSTITGFLHADLETRDEYKDSTFTNSEYIERGRKEKREKYLASHRLEWRPLDNFHLGINENVISGDRAIEPGYLFPILPLRWMEHYYGDQDNATMSFDYYYRPVNNLSLYGELFIDDQSYEKSWTKFYGNKWAFLSGIYNSNFLNIPYLNFRFEYSRVEPYVYTHKYHINRYMSTDDFLGSKFGPDSESMDFQLDYFFDFNTNIAIGYTRANSGEPIAGKEDAPEYDKDTKKFLRGRIEKYYYYYADLNYRYNNYLAFNLFYSHTDIINLNHEKSSVYANNTVCLTAKTTFKNYLPYFSKIFK